MPLALALVDDEIFAPQLSTHNPICPPTEVGGYGNELENLKSCLSFATRCSPLAVVLGFSLL